MGWLKKVSLKPGAGGCGLGKIFSIFTESLGFDVNESGGGGSLNPRSSFLSGNKRQAIAKLTLVTPAISFDE